MADPKLYSIVVPIFNSAPLVAQLHERLSRVMVSVGQPYELIFVDDCSTDASWNAVAVAAHEDPHVIAARLAINVGQARVTLHGIARASGDPIITLDDDLQHAPEDIPRLLAVLEGPADYDAVFGVPIARRHPWWRRSASWMVNLALTWMVGKPMNLRFAGFCAIRRRVVAPLLAAACGELFIPALLLQIAPRIGTVRVEHFHSQLGASRYSAGRLARLTLACFACVSDHQRRNVIVCAIIIAACLPVLIWSIVCLALPTLAEKQLPFAICVGVGVLILGAAAVKLERRIREDRRKPSPVVVAQQEIYSRRTPSSIWSDAALIKE